MLILRVLVGEQIAKIERVLYTHQGSTDFSDGELQITTSNGRVVLLGPGAYGQLLRVSSGAWVDPFSEPLDADNRAFVEKSGKWTIFDFSSADGFNEFMGSTIVAVVPIRDSNDRLRGVRIVADHRYLSYVVEWDEGYLTLNDDSLLASFGFHLSEH